jgi:phage terminase large subunit GpA-like protein
MNPIYHSLEALLVEAAAGVRPPERLSVSQAAEKYRMLNNPGSYVGPWDNGIAPYLVDVMDVLSSVSYTAMVFAGPAQCGKTDIFLNWQLYSVLCDPADMMLIQTSQTSARDFSKRRIDRLHRHTRLVGKKLIQHRNSDNTFDKVYSNGMMLTLSWPTINELSGKPIPRLWLTDYDRMPMNIDDEGSPFDLARKRATTFRSHGMTAVESSPGYVIENPRWTRTTQHEAPPTQGVLSLYNRGDRRRWYWRCISCHHTFEPDFSLLSWPETPDVLDAAEQATMACPHCGQVYHHDRDERLGTPGKADLNRAGRWVKDGMIWRPDGQVVGTAARSDVASFWLKGVAASFADWKTLVVNYVKASEEYEKTGSQEALKTTTNVDQGTPYVPKGAEGNRLPEALKSRAKDYGMRMVPVGVRFLVGCIDVQKNRFVCQVHGVGEGGDIWVIDRFDIRKSARVDEDGERLWVNPGAYAEDWQLITDELLLKTWPLADGSGREMAVKLTLCDSGGREGVTSNAYTYWRWLRDECPTPNLQRRFQLVKGANNKAAPRVALSYPDSERKDRHAGARGEIPVLFINSDQVKDQLDKMLERTDPGGGRINFASWLPDTFYTELTVEIRTIKGWENPKNYRNESWDLLCYAIAGVLSRHVRIEQIDWTAPPSWADEWEINDLVYDPKQSDKPFVESSRNSTYDLAALASTLG